MKVNINSAIMTVKNKELFNKHILNGLISLRNQQKIMLYVKVKKSIYSDICREKGIQNT